MIDGLWNWVMALSPGAKAGVFEIRDLLNVGITAIGVWVAIIANQILKSRNRYFRSNEVRKPDS